MNSILRSTGIVALSTLASRILGFVRDMLMASCFGATGQTDAFFVAFKIPNLFRRFVAEGALTVSFIPVYSDYLVNRGKKEAMDLAARTLSILLIILVLLLSLGEIFSPQIVSVFAVGFSDPEKTELAVFLNRIMFPYLFFVSLVAFSMGVLNSHKYFFAPAFAPVFLNVGMIFGILCLAPFFDRPITGAAAGVIIGGILQIILQIPYMIKTGFRMKFSLDFRHPGIRKIFSMLVPALFGMAVYQINSLIITVMASCLESGAISYIYYSDRLTELVLGVFIVSIGNVILPEMSRLSAKNSLDDLKAVYIKSLRAALFMAVPATAALMALGLPIIASIFMRNNFSPENAVLTYKALFFAAMGIPSLSVLRLTTPVFYSLKDMKTPVASAAAALAVNIAAGGLLMNTELRHAGLTLALSLSSTVQVLILAVILRSRTGKIGFGSLMIPVMKYVLASAVMTAFCLSVSGTADWTSAPSSVRWGLLAVIVPSGAGIYALCCWILKVPELRYLTAGLSRRFRKK